MNIKLNFSILIIIPNIKAEEAKACTRKYLSEDSVDIKLLSLIRGIKVNKLISNPIQALIHELDEIVINDPKIIITKNKIFE